MKPLYFLALIVLVLPEIYSCRSTKLHVNAAKVEDLEDQIHKEFYRAFQNLNLASGITVVPISLNVKFEHVTANTASGGFTAFSIIQSNYSYQSTNDNSVTDILAPTKLSESSTSSFNKSVNVEAPAHCAFDSATDTANHDIDSSIKNLHKSIEAAANAFVKIPNLGLLNDHQVTLDLKFTISQEGYVIVSPGFSILGAIAAKFTIKLDKTVTTTNEIQFTFDVVQGDPKGLGTAGYYNLRKSKIDDQKGICSYFPSRDYTNVDSVKELLSPPPAYQHGFSACVAYAVGYNALSIIMRNQEDTFSNTNEYSPDFIFAQKTNPHSCNGLDIPSVLDFVVNYGDCLVKDLPLVDTMSCTKYTDSLRKKIGNLIPKAAPLANRLKNSWFPLDPNDVDQIRLCIQNNEAVIAAFYVSSSFMNMWDYGSALDPSKNIWNVLSGPYYDAHCVCIVGYDNKAKLFKVRNSWGMTNSAKDGFFYVTYDLVERGCFNQAYTFIPKPKN